MKKKAPIDPQELQRLIAKAKKDLSTPAGKQALSEAFERGHREAQRLRNISIPTSRSLKRPITI